MASDHWLVVVQHSCEVQYSYYGRSRKLHLTEKPAIPLNILFKRWLLCVKMNGHKTENVSLNQSW